MSKYIGRNAENECIQMIVDSMRNVEGWGVYNGGFTLGNPDCPDVFIETKNRKNKKIQKKGIWPFSKKITKEYFSLEVKVDQMDELLQENINKITKAANVLVKNKLSILFNNEEFHSEELLLEGICDFIMNIKSSANSSIYTYGTEVRLSFMTDNNLKNISICTAKQKIKIADNPIAYEVPSPLENYFSSKIKEALAKRKMALLKKT